VTAKAGIGRFAAAWGEPAPPAGAARRPSWQARKLQWGRGVPAAEASELTITVVILAIAAIRPRGSRCAEEIVKNHSNINYLNESPQ
jgi:hypothetical protein